MVKYEPLALEFAIKKHAGQFRADGVTPYINHPILVAKIVKKFKKSKDIDLIVSAALLHDTLEDTYTSYRELVDNFGEIIASMVMEVTSASYMINLVGKAPYLALKLVAMSNYALVIKLADRLANVIDVKSLSQHRKEKLHDETVQILDYLESHRELTATQKNLVKEIHAELKNLEHAENDKEKE